MVNPVSQSQNSPEFWIILAAKELRRGHLLHTIRIVQSRGYRVSFLNFSMFKDVFHFRPLYIIVLKPSYSLNMSYISKDFMCASVPSIYTPSLQHLLLEMGNLNCAYHIHTQRHHIQSRGGFATMLILGDIIHEWHIPVYPYSLPKPEHYCPYTLQCLMSLKMEER